MATLPMEHDEEIIIVEFAPVPGVRSVSLSPKDAIEKSQEAIDDALKAMGAMAKKTVKAIKDIPVSERPGTIAVSFGLKLTAEGSAVLAKAGMEAGINVTMTWSRAAPATAKSKRK
jgi:tRNA A37 threonylcarbamoyltransferase TsaD